MSNIRSLQSEFHAAAHEPAVNGRLRAISIEPEGSRSEAFEPFFHGQLTRFADMVKQAGFRSE